WTRVVFDGRTIAGNVLMPFFTQGYEGFDVNRPLDWRVAEELVASGEGRLPPVPRPPYLQP
ncbi:MAG: acylneuraminate cytidylyltransferase family protein, partial [Gemmatimonadetes bacterium]|nr:acylneuraminate cytidylyltransferase family protein [Gemmatimonadota bacterium]